MTTFAALGDSITLGLGDPLPGGAWRGWAARFGTLHFDAAAEPQTYDRRSWSVDRLHPSERGHRLIACSFYDKLAAAGHPVGGRPGAEPSLPAPTRAAEFAWMATKGTGWVLRRSTDLVPYLLAMAVREWWAGSEPGSPEAPARPGPGAQARPGAPGKPLPVPGHERGSP
jgi:hypothetical protein